ncbi:FAD-dependent monooxygenase [Streptomonospora nanhaiensis]|uniref:2-polyprenyl-6-methoxyphenol hydroxylase-like FAD-dependent oxidoreductase n=1 Tax=Streptomonospora nanhaiensis TaxID=1323731 RepID=A0A853BRZ6_9ACTN|nr:FAD-dependent monooxygenase [Streptomonospora nanhaiensis]MBV2362738.1 FAD-dependent monooxygenase [Streptomonospora nanhaiensis]MBX9389770.1 FAD-dependent monooxygenase [Streptomonospora nanhaiensis]NYI97913.1 2-polyprenyl-6-methoxyphenol hydroxylase-like FAD-dependent oxidoreductase [Streptomonospora nanhaiensis]
MGELTATVVGGGIAGLASALGLARAGWRTTVLERRTGTPEVGAGVAVPRNGQAALRALGFGDESIAEFGYATLATGFRDTRGRRLLHIRADSPAVRAAVAVWGFERRRLHAALRRAAEDAGVEPALGARVTGVVPGSPGGPRATVRWRADATEHAAEADLVVGADGMWSAVRGAVFPGARPRYSGSTSWRALVSDDTLDGALVEYWGPGAEFGSMRVSASEVYWYGYIRSPEGAVFDDEYAAVRARFAGWAPEIGDLIGATDPERLMRHDVHHLPDGLPAYVRGRVVMVGDAAHAALPTMGQGAATALEDGAVLGRLVGESVASGHDLGRALAAFDALRRPRCRAMARQARFVARVGADLGGGWRQAVRNAAVRLVPAQTLVRAVSPLVGWTPPRPLGAAAPARD